MPRAAAVKWRRQEMIDLDSIQVGHQLQAHSQGKLSCSAPIL